MSEQFEDKVLDGALSSGEKEATNILNDKDKLLSTLTTTLKVVNKLTGFDKYMDDIKTLICLVKDYFDKKYTEIPKRIVITIICLFIYLINPLDIIPDAIPIIGSLDDLAVCAFALRIIRPDLEKYKIWKKTQC